MLFGPVCHSVAVGTKAILVIPAAADQMTRLARIPHVAKLQWARLLSYLRLTPCCNANSSIDLRARLASKRRSSQSSSVYADSVDSATSVVKVLPDFAAVEILSFHCIPVPLEGLIDVVMRFQQTAKVPHHIMFTDSAAASDARILNII